MNALFASENIMGASKRCCKKTISKKEYIILINKFKKNLKINVRFKLNFWALIIVIEYD